MSSFTSISDAARWKRVLRSYVIACLALGLVLGAFLIAADPYDTGRLAVLTGYGVPELGQRLSGASIGREPDADAAILGNSTIQLLDPARLAALTGLHFVSLAVAGTGPLEQLTVADWFLRHHQGSPGRVPKAVVFGLDQTWCQSDGGLAVNNPFPFWLYSESTLTYAVNLLRLKTFEEVERKLKLVFGHTTALRRDGYRDYDTGHHWNENEARRNFAAAVFPGVEPALLDFAAVPRLQRFLDALPATTTALLIFLPRHHSALPPAGSAADHVQTRCKAAFAALAGQRPDTLLLDLLADGPLARDDRGFWDQVHYRQPIARVIEDRIAKTLRPHGTVSVAPVPSTRPDHTASAP